MPPNNTYKLDLAKRIARGLELFTPNNKFCFSIGILPETTKQDSNRGIKMYNNLTSSIEETKAEEKTFLGYVQDIGNIGSGFIEKISKKNPGTRFESLKFNIGFESENIYGLAIKNSIRTNQNHYAKVEPIDILGIFFESSEIPDDPEDKVYLLSYAVAQIDKIFPGFMLECKNVDKAKDGFYLAASVGKGQRLDQTINTSTLMEDGLEILTDKIAEIFGEKFNTTPFISDEIKDSNYWDLAGDYSNSSVVIGHAKTSGLARLALKKKRKEKELKMLYNPDDVKAFNIKNILKGKNILPPGKEDVIEAEIIEEK